MITLAIQERNTGVWQKIKRSLIEDLDHLRRQLEGAKDHDETNRLRGRIQQIRVIIESAEEVQIEREVLQSF